MGLRYNTLRGDWHVGGMPLDVTEDEFWGVMDQFQWAFEQMAEKSEARIAQLDEEIARDAMPVVGLGNVACDGVAKEA